MTSPIFTISGIRGVIGESLTAEAALELASTFGAWVSRGSIVVGRDTRPTGEMIRSAVFAGLASVGRDVIDLGLAPSPKVVFAVKSFEAVGGIIITASHNPPEWNGMKFIGPNGLLLTERQLSALKEDWSRRAFKPVDSQGVGRVLPGRLSGRYERSVVGLVDTQVVRKAELNVVVDPGNGAGSLVTPYILGELGCRVKTINALPDGTFPRPIEPTNEALSGLVEAVKASSADVGLAHDCDADRLVCVTEEGEVLPEDLTLAIVLEGFLRANPGSVFVTNVASSNLFDDIARKYASKVYRTRVGESYVVQGMIEVSAPIGGEGSCGGVILPVLSHTRDGILAAAKVCEALAQTRESLSTIVGRMPRYYSVRTRLPCSREEAERVVKYLIESHRGEETDTTDGFKVTRRGGWVLVRASGTEPILRIMSESRNPDVAEALNDELRAEVETILASIQVNRS